MSKCGICEILHGDSSGSLAPSRYIHRVAKYLRKGLNHQIGKLGQRQGKEGKKEIERERGKLQYINRQRLATTLYC